jgi:hypothetical protein
VKRSELRTDERESDQEAAAEPPAPAVVPGSLEWASAVGNHAVAQLARQAAEPEAEEEAAPEEAEEESMAPEDEEAAAAVADVDEEQLPQ